MIMEKDLNKESIVLNISQGVYPIFKELSKQQLDELYKTLSSELRNPKKEFNATHVDNIINAISEINLTLDDKN